MWACHGHAGPRGHRDIISGSVHNTNSHGPGGAKDESERNDGEGRSDYGGGAATPATRAARTHTPRRPAQVRGGPPSLPPTPPTPPPSPRPPAEGPWAPLALTVQAGVALRLPGACCYGGTGHRHGARHTSGARRGAPCREGTVVVTHRQTQGGAALRCRSGPSQAGTRGPGAAQTAP